MSEAIKKSDIVQGDPFKEISNDIASTLGSLEQFDKALKSIASTMVNDLGKASAKTVQDIEAINKAEIESEKLLQQKLRTQKLQIDLEAKNQRLKEQQAKAIERAAKATASEVREAEKANSIYTRVDRKLAGMVKTYRDLAIRKELGAKLTAKEQREYDYLQGKIQKYDAALKTVDATMGKHQRNVGNYASGTAQLNFSVTQLAREMPAFANSVQTGFMAISNNLPMFFDEIGRLKTANAELAAAGKPTQSVFKSLAGSLMSTQVLLSVGVTLLTLYGGKLIEWASNLGGVNKAAEENARITKIRNEDAKKSRQYVAEESAEFVGNIMMLKATNAGSKERAKLIKEINEEYGSTIQNLKDEKKFQAQLNAEVNNYIEFQKLRYRLERNQNLMNANLEKQDKLQAEINKAEKENVELIKQGALEKEKGVNVDARTGLVTETGKLVNKNIELAAAYYKNTQIIAENKKELDAATKRMEAYGFSSLSAKEQIEKFGYKIEDTSEKTVKAQKEINTAFKDGNEYVSKYIQLNQELIQIQQGRTITQHKENIDAMLANEVKFAEDTGQAQVDELERVIHEMYVIQAQFIEQQRDFKLKAIEDEYQREKTLRLKALQDERDDLLKGADGNTDAQAKINANYQVKLTALNKEEETRYKDVQKEKEVVTAETVDKVTGLKQEEYDEINRVNNEIIEAQIDFADKTNATNQKTHDEEMKLIKERYEVIMSVQQAITDAIQYQIDKRIELLQKESDAAAKQQDFLQNLAANGNIYAQQSIAEQIRIQREAQQEQLRLERAKQSVELVSTGLKTFESALSEGKTPAEALASTIVNTQVLTSFLKNLQFYESGTMNAPGGLSVVDEKGAELITDRRGNIKEIGTGKGARFTTLSPGDRVYTATQTSALLNSFEGAATMSQMPKANGAGLGFDTAILTRELKELQNIVANKSESNVHWQSFSSGIAEIVQSKQVGGRKITNRFRVK
jgi:hypothetical protein